VSYDLTFTSGDGGAGVPDTAWPGIVAAVTPLLPGCEVGAGDGWHQLSFAPIGLDLGLADGELTVSVPYWHEGPEAERVVGLLREVAAAVERSTGLVAYDPQADRPFLAGGADTAAATFDRVRPVVEAAAQGGPDGAQDGRRRSRWRRRS
jgi:hypothetical protein